VELDLQGKVAIVTGAGRGIGFAIAEELAREGCDLALVELGQAEGARALAERIEGDGRRAKVYEGDVASATTADDIVAEVGRDFGRLDILVCNAGITRDATCWKMSESEWDDVIRVNLRGYFTFNRAVARIFKQRGAGKIVNIASINGLRGKFGQSNYAAAKAGGIAMSKSLARELGRYGVNVNVVAPGMVMTEMAKQIPEEFIAAAREEAVLECLATPADVAGVVAFLCSARAAHITGEVIKVDGGQYI